MATVGELSEPYAAFMRNPLPPDSPDVCEVCLCFTDGRFPTCYPCGHRPQHTDAVLPISYTGYDGQLYHALKQYKRHNRTVARQLQRQLAAVLWKFFAAHERCLGDAAGIESNFEIVTTVPSSDPDRDRDEIHPLRKIVGETVGVTRDRFERLLARTDLEAPKRDVVPEKFSLSRQLDNASVLLIDDTWVSGGSVQSAAGALKAAGSGAVGVVVLGRLIDQAYENQGERLAALPKQFNWDTCALHNAV
jgi:predicted amidophosphoribosyltransferase